MKIPKYWARATQVARQPGGRVYSLDCWQWSDVSLAEAQAKATAKARELALKVQSGATLNRYAYDERPLREEPIQGLQTGDGREVGVVTRNKYGARVLNATTAMFIDIDFNEDQGFALARAVAAAMAAATSGQTARPVDPFLQPVLDWASQHRDVGLRIYRTAAGLRCLITNQVFDPTHAESRDILQALGSDPLYIRLCQAQGCFRARLTPKPWRAKLELPPAQYPFENARVQGFYRSWEQRYERGSAAFGVCQLVRQVGPADIHPDVAPVLALHDQVTRVGEQRPLA